MDTAEQNTAEPEMPITPAPDRQNWLALHDMGFSLIPLMASGKGPYIAWQVHQKKRAQRSKVEAWYKATPNANIGIVTGAISELVVLDLDSAEAIAEAERRGLPDTLTVRTGKGRHVYFRHPGHPVTNRAGFLPGMDIRGDGGYVVAPGSIHPNGAVYAWENPPGQFEIAVMPEWLVEALETPTQKAKPAPAVSMPSAPVPQQADSAKNKWATAALNSELRELASSPEGQRNHRLNIAALKLGQIVAGGRLDAQMVAEQLGAVARTIGLDPAEIEPTIASGMKKGLTQPRRSSRDVVNLKDLENYTGGSKPSEDVIASCFTAINRDTLKFCHSAGKWYQWTGVYWQRNEVKLAHHYARLIARKLSDGDPKVSKASVANGAESFARAHPAHAVTAEFWDKDTFLLGTLDGTVDLRTGTLRPPEQADGITKLTGCSPAPGEPTLWLRFLHEATGGDESMIRYLQQACGYMLTGDTREHALFFVYGPGGNGKSVFLNTASAIMGDYATSHGETAGTSKQFGSKLAKRGLRAKPMRAEGQVQKVYQGIELKPRAGGPIF